MARSPRPPPSCKFGRRCWQGWLELADHHFVAKALRQALPKLRHEFGTSRAQLAYRLRAIRARAHAVTIPVTPRGRAARRRDASEGDRMAEREDDLDETGSGMSGKPGGGQR
jgi:hypothetical protein